MISSSNATSTSGTSGSSGKVARVNSAADLARSLAQEAAELEALLALLGEEQQALQERDGERVYALASAKSERLAQLGALDASRGSFLRANGLPPGRAGMQGYLELTAASGVSAAALQNWQRLLELATEARRINTVNGRLIAAQLRFVGGALSSLQQTTGGASQQVPSRLLCYGADGQTRNAPASRSLASA